MFHPKQPKPRTTVAYGCQSLHACLERADISSQYTRARAVHAHRAEVAHHCAVVCDPSGSVQWESHLTFHNELGFAWD